MKTPPRKSSLLQTSGNALSDVVDIMATLRGPEGCPWDREQTTESLKPYLLEEVYEVLEAIDAKDPSALKEELGDLLLQILFHSQIASEQGDFSYQDVNKELREKLIRRHPHVFHKTDKASITTTGQVLEQWDQLKQQEKGGNQSTSSVLGTVPKTTPALQRALQVQKRASRVGFDWNTIQPVLQKFKEELDELYAATASAAHPSNDLAEDLEASLKTSQHCDMEAELGDVFFSLVNVSRFLRINPEDALRKATNKFIKRFQFVESQSMAQGKNVKDFPPDTLDQWWEAAKRQESESSPQMEA
ncbi:MAG: nucleoside triphosphate pyrophosphohydrolase [Nitrospirales bacterium]